MTRFNPATYDPKTDSTPGLERAGAVVLSVPFGTGYCGCGCAAEVTGKKSKFRMGHDAKLKGKLLRAHLAEFPVVTVSVEEAVERTAAEHAASYGWAAILDAASDKARANLRERNGAQPEPKPASPAVGNLKLIKVGRWEYTAKVVGTEGDELVLEYLDRQGRKLTARRPVSV